MPVPWKWRGFFICMGIMQNKIKEIEARALQELESGLDLKKLEDWQVQYLGKKGELTLLLRETGKLPDAERPAFGASVNQAKQQLLEKADLERVRLEAAALEARLSQEKIDVTLPGRSLPQGSVHLINSVMQECCEIFARLGFNVEVGPELEDSFHNFDALNVPPEHPARDTQDSYFVGDKLLRTQSSSVQIRVMQKKKPPIRMVAPGRVFRRDALDATHGSQFHQLEGLAVDSYGKVRLSDLKGTLESFISLMFGRELKSRLRPSFFPFTEPSLEVDMTCFQCKGSGCSTCKKSGWIELGGAGMVHPNVFKAVGYEAEAWSGFAFGFGLDRIAMMRHKVPDIRLFTQNDLRFLRQF
jgi:phenylalanyl-tRNA synthetase alpha chain